MAMNKPKPNIQFLPRLNTKLASSISSDNFSESALTSSRRFLSSSTVVQCTFFGFVKLRHGLGPGCRLRFGWWQGVGPCTVTVEDQKLKSLSLLT